MNLPPDVQRSVDNLKNHSIRFAEVQRDLIELAPVAMMTANTARQYGNIMADAARIRSAVTAVTNKADMAAAMLDRVDQNMGAFGFSVSDIAMAPQRAAQAVKTAVDFASSKVKGWTASAGEVLQKDLDFVRQKMASGEMSQDQAAEYLKKVQVHTPSTTENMATISNNATKIVLVFGGLYLLRKLI